MDALNEKIANLDRAHVARHANQAVTRVQSRIDAAVSLDDLPKARALIEKLHLICGDRRLVHIDVSSEKRHI